MKKAEQRLLEAYGEQEQIYAVILELVKEQKELLDGDTEPECSELVRLCAEVEDHLDSISTIESEIAVEKRQWLHAETTLPPALEAVLGRIEDLIERTRDLQEEVQAHMARIYRLGSDAALCDQPEPDVPLGTSRAVQAYSAS